MADVLRLGKQIHNGFALIASARLWSVPDWAKPRAIAPNTVPSDANPDITCSPAARYRSAKYRADPSAPIHGECGPNCSRNDTMISFSAD
ncbi:MAG TPA: hypothetical protein VF444_18805 [Pseudonocardiaceae bacterium]